MVVGIILLKIRQKLGLGCCYVDISSLRNHSNPRLECIEILEIKAQLPKFFSGFECLLPVRNPLLNAQQLIVEAALSIKQAFYICVELILFLLLSFYVGTC